MYARDISQHDATLSYMEDAFHCFHTFKDGSLLGQAGKKVQAKDNALRTELVKKRQIHKEMNAETWTPSKKRLKLNAWMDSISHEIGVSKQLDADFNFPKIQLMSHRVEKTHHYGAFSQYSATRLKQPHNTNLNDGWNPSCHNVNHMPQVITGQHRIVCFKVWEPNLYALAQCQEFSTASCTVLPACAFQAAPLSPQSYANPEFVGPQNGRDGKHPDPMINDF